MSNTPVSEKAVKLPVATLRAFQTRGDALKAAYRTALRLKNEANARYENSRPEEPPMDAPDDIVDAHIEAIEAAVVTAGLPEANDVLRDAENGLIEWLRDVMKATHPEGFERISLVFERAQNLKVRTELVSKAVRMIVVNPR
jgi:hypothetical protein